MKRINIVIAFLLCATICTANAANTPNPSQSGSAAISNEPSINMDSTIHMLDSKCANFGTELQNLSQEVDTIKNIKLSGLESKISKHFKLLICVIIVVVVLWFILFFYFQKDKKNRREEIITTTLYSNRIRSWICNINETPNKQCTENGSQRIVDELKKRVDLLEQKLKTIEERESHPRTPSYPPSNNPPSTLKARKLYAESIQDSRYVKVKEIQTVDAIFELTVKPDNVNASVTICKDAHKKILANPTFLDGCDKSCIGNTSLSIIEEGTAIRTDDNKWMVRKQIKVEIR